jgi:hypothetical protein
MKTKNLIKALEKIGVELKVDQRRVYDHFAKEYQMSTPNYYGDNGKNKISFYDQGGEVVCCQVMGIRCENDYMSDYFAGYFARTIKSAINGMVN